MQPKDIRVLLIDDEEDLIENLSKRLLREGFTVKASTTQNRSLALAAAERFDVAVVDLRQHDIDAIEILAGLHELRPFLQCIMLTGQGFQQSAFEGDRHGAFLFLEKPADHEVLVKAIHDAAAEKRQSIQAHFRKELEQLTSSGRSPREIMHALAMMREKFERA